MSQFQPPTPMAICGQRTHSFTGIATKTWCGHHFRTVSSETERQNSILQISLFEHVSNVDTGNLTKNPMTRIPKPTKSTDVFKILCQVEQQIANLCFRSINDPVELGLTGGGGPWAHWVQLVIKVSFKKSFGNIWVNYTSLQPHRPGYLGMSQGKLHYRWLPRQSAARSFLSNRLWHSKLSECLGPPVEPKPGLVREDAEFVFTKQPFYCVFFFYDQKSV